MSLVHIIVNLTKRIAHMSATLDAVKAALTNASSAVTAAEQRIADLKGGIATRDAHITDLTTQSTALQAAAAVPTASGATDDELSALKAQIDALALAASADLAA